MSVRTTNAEGKVAMSSLGTRSREELGDRLRAIARIAAVSRAATAAEERTASSHCNPRQVTIGQILFLVALWALGMAAWRLNW
jgi:hypothetical protein